MNGLRVLALMAVAALYCGCSPSGGAINTAAVDPTEPTHAQPKLATLRIYVGTEPLVAEVALTPEQLHTGMMYRTNRLDEDAGMLFPLPYTQQASFWMKHCPVPLSAAYIDPEGIIQEIHVLKANDTNSVVAASENIRFVLECSEGWFDRHHIKPGVAVATERGPLMQTFFPKR
jgi:uncharacterized membrane protein (UPF0127 family)